MGLKLTVAVAIIGCALAIGVTGPANAASTSGLGQFGATTTDALSLTDTVNLRCYRVCRGPYWRRVCTQRCEPSRRRYWIR